MINYVDNEETKIKKIDVYVTQTLFSIKVKTKTDINSSFTVSASIEQEYGNYFLYYTYITDPNANVQKDNPIQHGTCRMMLQTDTQCIEGKYWTSGRRTGDIYWKAVKSDGGKG